MTSRADKLLEGFKLGSLGVSRKPKVTSEPEKKPEIIDQVWKTEDHDTHLYQLMWYENSVGKDLITLVGDDYIDSDLTVVVSLKQDKRTPLTKILPLLSLTYKKTDLTKKQRLAISKKFVFEDVDMAKEWLFSKEDEVKQKGLAAIGFPQEWKNMPLSEYLNYTAIRKNG
jgi:hypothetical protein